MRGSLFDPSFYGCRLFENRREDEEEEDVVFVVDGEHIAAHRFVLAARSQYFAERFRTVWKDKRLIPVSKGKVLFYF